MSGQRGFWDVEDRLRALSRRGDPLERLQATVDFEMFRPELSRAMCLGARPKGGRPPFDVVLKFRMFGVAGPSRPVPGTDGLSGW